MGKPIANLHRIIVLLWFLLAPSLYAATGMTPEEQAVRTAYARLAYGIQLRAVHQAVQKNKTSLTTATLNQQLQAGDMLIQLSNFWVGNVAELGDRKYSDLVTKPMGQILGVAVAGYTYTAEDGTATRENNAEAQWLPAELDSENWDVNAVGVIRGTDEGRYWNRVATFTVNVSYLGTSRAYSAFFLFGKDSTGKAIVLALDNVINNSALTFFAQNPVYPTTLFKQPLLATNPAVRDWLTATQVQSESCQTGGAACCDPNTLKCGPSATDVKKLPALPAATPQSSTPPASAPLKSGPIANIVVPPPPLDCSGYNFTTPIVPYDIQGSEQHSSGGYHDFVAGMDGSCTYSDVPSSPECQALSQADAHASMVDKGTVIVAPFCHKTAYNTEGGAAYNGTA